MTKKAILKRTLLVAFVLTAITILFTLTTAAETISGYCGATGNGSNATWIYEIETGVLTIRGTGAMKSYNIPWSYLKEHIKSVVIGDDIINVGENAFDGCKYLKNITIGNNVASIGKKAFASCTLSLASITIPDSVISIGDSAFSNCQCLKNVTIGNNVTNIGRYAFTGCINLTNVAIPKSVLSIDYGAFQSCRGLKDIYINSKKINIYDDKDTISDTATIHGYAGSTAQAYAEKYGRTFVAFPEIIDNITVLEAKVVYTPTPDSEGTEALISYSKGDAVLDLLYADKATGALKFKTATGDYEALYSKDGSVLSLGTTPVSLAVIYDDIRGTVRYFVNGFVPYYGVEESRVLANDIPVSTEFIDAEGEEKFDILTSSFNELKMYNIHDSGTAEIVALQENIEDSRSVRLLAGVDMLYYGAVGFETELYIDGQAQNKTSEQSGIVYSSVIADNETVLPSDYGFRYFATLTIEDVDLYNYYGMAVHLIIRPYTQVGTTKYYGSPKKVDITEIDGEYSYAFDESYIG